MRSKDRILTRPMVKENPCNETRLRILQEATVYTCYAPGCPTVDQLGRITVCVSAGYANPYIFCLGGV